MNNILRELYIVGVWGMIYQQLLKRNSTHLVEMTEYNKLEMLMSLCII